MKSLSEVFTLEEVMEALGVYECSAREILDGTIKLTKGEIQELAVYKGYKLMGIIE